MGKMNLGVAKREHYMKNDTKREHIHGVIHGVLVS